MLYAAENSLEAIEEDPGTKLICDAYTAGVNSYILSLEEKDLPLEFKLLNYKPELWTNLKTSLFLKYMSYDLSGHDEDFERTNAKAYFTKEQYIKLFPLRVDSLVPIIPSGKILKEFNFAVQPPASADSIYFNYKKSKPVLDFAAPVKPSKQNGSNNWALDSTKTKSGKPLLSNDPHLGLNLPSIWYEMQLSTPEFNAYGVTFPGAGCVIIGFNDSCAWGSTNAERDVRDYYEIEFRDGNMNEYLFNGQWVQTKWRNEIIKKRDKGSDTIKIAMTVWGPVLYDANYPGKLQESKAYAVKWKAHDKSNELRTFYKLNKAKNYRDYVDALSTYKCPAQNIIFASKNGDIAIRQQGEFPARWYRQGEFVMPGYDSAYAWQGNVPDSFNYIMHNPQRGFVSSANQHPYDPVTYPYYFNGWFWFYRGMLINRQLNALNNATAEDMMRMQMNNYNIRAEIARPILIRYIHDSLLDNNEKNFLQKLSSWNLYNNAVETGATVFTLFMDSVMAKMYDDEFMQSALPMPRPEENTMINAIAKDSMYEFADNILTAERETVKDIVTAAFKSTVSTLLLAEDEGRLQWGIYKDGGIRHLLKIPQLSRLHLKAGGGKEIINAFTQYGGPSWRMVVDLADGAESYGVYPGGQSGNPGSKYYDNFINSWLNGKYYKIHIRSINELQQMKDVPGKITFNKM